MKTQEQIDLENSLTDSLKRRMEKLLDSPLSFSTHYNHITGYYHGFCQAKGWAADIEVLKEWDKTFWIVWEGK